MAGKIQSSGRTARGRTKSYRPMSDINVTPLVDVMLVLLIVFMITAPLLTAGIAIDLPDARAKALAQQDNTPVEIVLEPSGRILLGDAEVKLDRLIALLGAISSENADRRVYLKADKRLSYGQVMSVMTAINQSGFTKVALITDSGNEPPPDKKKMK